MVCLTIRCKRRPTLQRDVCQVPCRIIMLTMLRFLDRGTVTRKVTLLIVLMVFVLTPPFVDAATSNQIMTEFDPAICRVAQVQRIVGQVKLMKEVMVKFSASWPPLAGISEEHSYGQSCNLLVGDCTNVLSSIVGHEFTQEQKAELEAAGAELEAAAPGVGCWRDWLPAAAFGGPPAAGEAERYAGLEEEELGLRLELARARRRVQAAEKSGKQLKKLARQLQESEAALAALAERPPGGPPPAAPAPDAGAPGGGAELARLEQQARELERQLQEAERGGGSAGAAAHLSPEQAEELRRLEQERDGLLKRVEQKDAECHALRRRQVEDERLRAGAEGASQRLVGLLQVSLELDWSARASGGSGSDWKARCGWASSRFTPAVAQQQAAARREAEEDTEVPARAMECEACGEREARTPCPAPEGRGGMANVDLLTPLPGQMFAVFFGVDAWAMNVEDVYVEDTARYNEVVGIKGPGKRQRGLEAVDLAQLDRRIQRRGFLDLMASSPRLLSGRGGWRMRALEVDGDSLGERHKDWKEVRRESTFHASRLRASAESFECFGCYDQVNMPCLVVNGVTTRRARTLREARSAPDARPSDGMADVHSGAATLEGAAAPDLRVYDGKALEETALEGGAQRGKLAKPQGGGLDEDDLGAASAGTSADGNRGAIEFEKEAAAELVAPVIAKPVAAPSQEEAARVLLRGHLSYDAEETYTAVAPYVLGAEDRLIIEVRQKSTMRYTDEFNKLNERLGEIKPFWDKKLSQNKETYRQFILDLGRRGMTRWTTASPSSTQGLSRIECESDFSEDPECTVTLGIGDVENCFHRLRLPDGMNRRFALHPTPAKYTPLRGSLCSEVILNKVHQLGPDRRASDYTAPIVLSKGAGVRYALCADNLDAVGSAHELKGGGGETLGCALDGHRLETQVTEKRRWRIDGAFRWALRRRRLSGKQLERLVGHATFVSLLGLMALSAFNACYAFIHRYGDAAAEVRLTARQELQAFIGLLPLVRAPWDLPWCETAQCASLAQPPVEVQSTKRSLKVAVPALPIQLLAPKLEDPSVKEAFGKALLSDGLEEADADLGSGEAAGAAQGSGSDDLDDATRGRCACRRAETLVSACHAMGQLKTLLESYADQGSWRAVKGWPHLCPGRSRHPKPFCAWAAVQLGLLARGIYEAGAALLGFMCSQGLPELLSNWRGHFVPPGNGDSRHWCQLRAPEKQVLLADMAVDATLVPMLVPHQPRHSVASHDRLRNPRGLPELMKGRWRKLESAARHEMRARGSGDREAERPDPKPRHAV
ncbi:unnamed protein product [Prorocentrum cordatum]|uniref:Uncharacterized protein n=1 Tax=Prorocentrum cordatum TaxID=2364126 RepID=A0ABN9XGI5_9DINO|nr:unnamed protein product [Polarella glacialis]